MSTAVRDLGDCVSSALKDTQDYSEPDTFVSSLWKMDFVSC